MHISTWTQRRTRRATRAALPRVSAATTVLGLAAAALIGGAVAAPASASAATADQLVSLAEAHLGDGPCDNGGFEQSCSYPKEWCAEFVRWLWHRSGVDHWDEINASAASVENYGEKYGTRHKTNPKVGDAVVLDYDADSNLASHVGTVDRVYDDGSIKIINGNGGNGRVDYSQRTAPNAQAGTAVNDSQDISYFVTPVGLDTPAPPAPTFYGELDHIVNDGGGTVHISGWAYDRKTPSTSIHVEVRDGISGDIVATLPANITRPDVDRNRNITGNHGFDGYVTGLQAGDHHLVLDATNGTDGQARVDDTSYTVAAPDGRLEHALSSNPGQLHIAGWAYDPDAPDRSIQIDVYTDGRRIGSLPANTTRADVNRNLNITGNHGYDGYLTAPSGDHTFTIYAVSGSAHTIIHTLTTTIE